MAPSGKDILTVSLLIDGKTNDAEIVDIEVYKGINEIARANVKLIDGSKSKEDFILSDSSHFIPGNKIEIRAGYNSKEKTIFKGIIMRQSISIDSDEGSSLSIECKNEAVKTTKVHNNAHFVESSDSEIISEILSNYTTNVAVENTAFNYEKVIQYGATDWDFIITRAEINGLIVVAGDEKFSVTKPAVSGNTVLDLTYGENIFKLDISVNSEDQLADVKATAWDAGMQKLNESNASEPRVNQQGNINGKKLSEVLNANDVLQSPVPLETASLKTWADAQLLKSRLSRFKGSILCEGNAAVLPNTLINLKGLGKRMNGQAYVSAVTHEINNGRWLTNITLGLKKNWFTQTGAINPLKAAGRIPAMNGLQIGIVKKIDEDPAEEFRVLVTLPLLKPSDEGIWARLSTFYASNSFGNFFYPEIGDEVILGFLDDNPTAPIILGSVYSKNRTPAFTPDERNTLKGITTRSKMTFSFDDEQKIIKIETPKENSVIISELDQGIRITDQNNNKILLNKDGISIDSIKDINIKAANDIKLTATNIEIKASSDLTLSGNNTTSTSSIAFSAEAGASAELKASGNVNVKGAMVTIN